MAKTKRKQLAALAALKVTSPESSRKPIEEHQDGHNPALNEEPNDKGLASLEVRQQRIIFWIPPLDPSPRLVNSRSFRISGTPSRKRKLSSVNEEEKTSSGAEDGHVYKKYAKIILKLDSWNSKKNIDAPPPLDVPALDAPPIYAEKAYQRRKPDSRIVCKERVLSLLTDNENLPASSSVPLVDKPSSKRNNSSSRVSKVKLQKRASAKKQDGVVRIRKRALTRTLGRRTSTVLESNSVQKLAALDDFRLDAPLPIALIDPVWNRVISSGAAVPSVDEPNEGFHHGSDVVTSSNNAALNSRSRRISFLVKHAGTTEEDPKRVNPGSNVQRENSTSQVNSVPTSGRANVNGTNQLRVKSGRAATSLQHQNGDNGHMGNNQLRAKSGRAATSLHHQNGDNGHIGNNQLRAKSEEAATSLQHQNRDNGHIGNSQLRAKSGGTATSLHHQNGDNGHTGNNQLWAKSGGAATTSQYQNRDNGYLGNNQLRAKAGGAVTSLNGDHGLIGNNQWRAKFGGTSASLHHQNGDNAHMGLIRQGGKQLKPQSRLHGSHVRNHNDVAAMVRSKLEEVGGLTEWLIGGGLGVFVDLFEERKIKEDDLLHLTMSSLKEIGVQAVGPRRKLIWMIEHLL